MTNKIITLNEFNLKNKTNFKSCHDLFLLLMEIESDSYFSKHKFWKRSKIDNFVKGSQSIYANMIWSDYLVKDIIVGEFIYIYDLNKSERIIKLKPFL